MGALSHFDTTQVVDRIEFPPDENPYESLKEHLKERLKEGLKERLTELHTLNLFQRYQALMSLTLAEDYKPSILMGKRCSLLRLDHRIHKTECFMFRGFFLNHLPLNICSHLMGGRGAPFLSSLVLDSSYGPCSSLPPHPWL